jgi:hypothetical protein
VLASTSSGNYEQAAIGKAFADVTLETGDMLYLPRGTIHQALCAGEQHSMHATISTAQVGNQIWSFRTGFFSAEVVTVVSPFFFGCGVFAPYYMCFNATLISPISSCGQYWCVCVLSAQNNSYADYLQDLLRIGVQMAAAQHLPLRRSVPRAMPHFMGFAHTQRDEDGDEMSGGDDGDTRREDLKDAAIQVRFPVFGFMHASSCVACPEPKSLVISHVETLSVMWWNCFDRR